MSDDDPVPFLRVLVTEWLENLRNSIVPGVTDPFPQGFPLKTFHIIADFDWLAADEITRHSYRVNFVFPGLPSPQTDAQSALVWTLSSGSVRLGCVQVDADILWDANPFLSIDSTLILESMATSVSQALPVSVTTRIAFERCDVSNTNSKVQVFELHTEGYGCIHIYGTRRI
ncbi:hypothetical protein HGRIS_000795 [Hohenbuehelia grisea]|uniref:Uncharacterized protein n=1 Tax=Hohenbuehelia grisea TaxID=104357 RepID=A0ABR3IPS7_9AGAR